MLMAETKIEERLISGTGVLRMPPGESAARYYSVLIDIIRLPTDINRSFRYNPFRQRFCTMVGLRNDYVVFETAIDYTKRRFDYLVNEPGQVLIALKCSHKQSLARFTALGASGAESNIEAFSNLEMLWDELRFVCYNDTAIQVRLFQDLYDDCGDDYMSKEPPPPPPPLPEVPPGTAIPEVSPPYPDGDDITTPYPGDGEEEPEGGDTGDTEPGTFYVVSYEWKQFPGGSILSEFVFAFGVIGDIRLKSGAPDIFQLWCQGKITNPSAPGTPLPSPQWVDIATRAYNTTVDLEVVDVSPY